MSHRTIVVSERMHAVLMHAIDCAAAWCAFEEFDGWKYDEKHTGAMERICEPIDHARDLVALRDICKEAPER